MATEVLNNVAYEVPADNLVLATKFPVLHRTVTIVNPKAEIKRGTAIINSSGTLYVAGAKSGESAVSGDIVAIATADSAADSESSTVAIDAYVSGAFAAGEVVTTNDWDATTAAHVLGAQGNGIYLL